MNRQRYIQILEGKLPRVLQGDLPANTPGKVFPITEDDYRLLIKVPKPLWKAPEGSQPIRVKYRLSKRAVWFLAGLAIGLLSQLFF